MRIDHVTTTGDVSTETSFLHEVTLTGGSDAATLTVKADGSSGSTVLVVKAAADTTVSVSAHGAQVTGGIHATLAGTGPVASFVYA